MLRVVLFPPPSFYGETNYDGGATYIRCLAGAKWAGEVYVFPSPEQRSAPARCERTSAKCDAETSPVMRQSPCHYMFFRFLPSGGKLAVGYIRDALRLARYLRRFAKDATVIHVNGVGCEVSAIAAKLAGFKHVFGTVHNLPGEGVEATRLIRRFVEHISFRCCDHQIFPSAYCWDRWRERARVSESHQLIYHGCRAGAFECKLSRSQAHEQLQVQPSSGSLVLGIAGRLDKCKGHDVLLRALSEIGGNVPVTLLVAGSGCLQEELASSVEDLGISDRVLFLGQCDVMPVFYRAIDVNVLPSLSEGLGYSVVEAMHAGLPQIVSDAGGMTELVLQSGAGIVFPSGDSSALASAIVDMYKRRDALDGYGKKAREFAERELTEERMLSRTLAFYEECLGKGVGKG